ncbi:spore germination protein [Paenibacillus sp. BSR1-1]|uniref:spore germination protein n=1 Tax=Paenibacillus sp. BSR1-1 TaxID=3020845 RepID=UPI0025B11E2C|nr:spore germination protein [Paenibacillus sp. BSR1-1]MDN3015988.1 spore germination protein [Paenibacillus sp. BSR1-1]
MKIQNKIINTLKQQLQETKDLIIHSFEYYNQPIHLVYIQNLCDAEKIKTDIIQPLMLCEKESKFLLHLLSLTHCQVIQNQEDLTNLLLLGNVLIFFSNEIYSYKVISVLNNQPEDATVEMVVQGPQKAFTQNLNTNLALIRKRYPSEKLKVEYQSIGTLSKTKIAILYDVNYADPIVINEVKNRLSKIDIDVIQSAGQLENALNKRKIHLFPTMMITERPDRTVLNLAEGKVIILINGTPFTLILPAVFFDFISSMDDLFHSFWIKMLMIVVRYLALLVTLILPALYIAITSYNPEILRSQLTLTIAGSRSGVPYPSFYEVLFMMLAVEMLVEASIRLPKAIGPTATTVGGLILGQAAQQAQLVSSIMIIVTAFVAIANFTIPVNAMSFAIRCIRYPLILFACFFGMVGLVGGVIVLLCILVDMRSFGTPFLSISWGSSDKIETITNVPKGGHH